MGGSEHQGSQREKQHPRFHTLLEECVSGRGQHGGSGASQLEWDWHCSHASICGSRLSSGNEKYEKILKEAKEKMEKDSQRDEAVVLGEAVAMEPPTDDLGTLVRTAAVLFHTCHTPTASLGPLAPCKRLPGVLVALGTSLPAPGHDHASIQHCPRGCPPLIVVSPPIDAPAS